MKALLLEFYHPVCVKIAEELRSRLQIEPLLITSSHLHEATIRERFPEALYLHGSDAKQGIWPQPFTRHEHAPFDAACEHVWRTWPNQMADLYRRWDHCGDYSHLEMTQNFYEQLVAWNDLLKTLKPEFIYFWEPPHVPYTVMLYALAEYYRIPVMLHEVCIGPFSLACNDLAAGGIQWREALRIAAWEAQAGFELDERSLHPESLAVIERSRHISYDKGMPWWQSGMLNLKSGEFTWAFWRKMARILKRSRRADRRRKQPASHATAVQGIYAYKEWFKPLKDSFKGRHASLKFGLAEVINHIKTLCTERSYRRFTSKEPPKDVRYILASLHYQPEMTSNPRGGLFLCQWIMINLLANSVPEGVEVWVKEHPAQFVSLGGTTSYRDTHLYQMLATMPRVRLIPVEANQFDLIDNSLAVATISGTVGIEGIARGKSALVFGDVWYERCRGAYRVRNLEDSRRAVAAILAGDAPPPAVPFPLVFKELENTAFSFGAEASLIGGGVATTAQDIDLLVLQTALLLKLPHPTIPTTVRLRDLLSA